MDWSDDLATIGKLFVRLSKASHLTALRLFQKLLRLFQLERYDYCWPLLAIGRKPEKEMRREPPVVPRRPPRRCCWTAPPGELCRAEPLRPYIPYYNRAAVLTCIASGVAVVSGICWRCCGAVIRSSVAQAVL